MSLTKDDLLEINDLLQEENETLRRFLTIAGQQNERLTAALRQSNERNKELAASLEQLTLQYEQQENYIRTLRDWATEHLVET
jgi:hypothetical protein